MPDLKGFQITRLANVRITVPNWQIEGYFCDEQTGQPLPGMDFTGPNAKTFIGLMGELTQAQQDELVARIIHFFLQKRFGIG